MSKLDDIAKVAGVSRHTVARILNGKRQEKWPAKQEQGDRIRRIAEEMGYRPNASARALVLGKFNSVGLLISTQEHRSAVTHEMLNALDEALSEYNTHLVLARLPDDRLTDAEFVPKILREWLCDGLIINYHTSVPVKMLKLIQDFKMPAVWLDNDLGKDAVYADYFGAAALATKRLVDLDHRRIVYADHMFHARMNYYGRKIQRDGYVSAMKDAGLKPEFIFDAEDKSGADFVENTKRALSGANRPTAMVAGLQAAARSVTFTARSMGIKVPEKLSYISFRDSFGGSVALWDDSCFVMPAQVMCRESVHMLMRKISQPHIEIASIKVPFDVYEGSTTLPLEV